MAVYFALLLITKCMQAGIKGDDKLLIDLKLPNGCQHQILSIVTTYLAVDTIEVIMTSLSDPELSDSNLQK